jgi:hypothetical protein
MLAAGSRATVSRATGSHATGSRVMGSRAARAMAASSRVSSPVLRTCPAAGTFDLAQLQVLPARHLRRRGGPVTALVCGGVLAAALWMAPEAPQDQAAICQRHNGAAACRVW